MAKLKEYPKILLEFSKTLISGDTKTISKNLGDFGAEMLDKILPDDSDMRYFLWLKNRTPFKYTPENQNTKFAIIYNYQIFNKKTYEHFEQSLKNQPYNNYKIYQCGKNTLNEIIADNCDYICFVEQGDVFTADALSTLSYFIHQNNNKEVIYTDNDILGAFGKRVRPYFKTDFAPLLLLSHNYMDSMLCVKVSDKLKNYDDFDFNSRYKMVLELATAENTLHIPDILYSKNYKNLKPAFSKTIIKDYLEKSEVKARIEHYYKKHRAMVKFLPNGEPMVSIIIPFKDKLHFLKDCIESIESVSTYTNYEIILINNRSEEKETLEYLENTRHRVIDADIDFNFSKLNNIGAKEANGEFLVLLNNDTKIISPDWLETMIGLASLEKVGAVGPKLLYPNNKLQHVGVITRERGTNHVNRLQSRNNKGYMHFNNTTREYTCLSGACLAIEKKKYFEVGGLTEELAVEWNDMDFCLKLIKAGYNNVFDPHAILYHFEKISRGSKHKSSNKQEVEYFITQWGEILGKDKFHNPNFSGKKSGFAVRIKD